MSPDGTSSTVRPAVDRAGIAAARAAPASARPRFGYVIAGVALGAVCGFLLSALPSRLYEADVALVVPVSQPDGSIDNAAALQDRITADAVLRPVVETLRLAADPMFGTAGVPGADAVVARLRSRISVAASAAPGAFTVNVQADSADKAARLANAVADSALGSKAIAQADLPDRRAAEITVPAAQRTASIAELLAPRIEAAVAARRSAEAALAALRAEGSGDEAALAGLRDTIAQLRAREAAAQERANRAQALIAASRRALESSGVEAGAGVPPQLLSMATDMAALSRLSALQAQVLGPQNPALVPLLGEIDRMRRARIAETERWASESLAALNQARADGAAAAAERERSERRAATLQARVASLRDAQLALERARAREAALREATGGETIAAAPAVPSTAPAVVASPPPLVSPAASARGSALTGTVVRRAVPPDRPVHPPVLAIVLMASLAGGAFGAFAGLRRSPPAA